MKKKFAVFDIDGTLIRWQLYHSVVDRLARRGALGQHAAEQIKNARMQWKTRHKPFKYYEKELIDAYTQALPMLNQTQLISVIDEVIEEYKDQTYTYTKNLLEELKKQNYFLLIVSGSHHEIIERLAKYYGFDDWIGAKYKQVGSHYTSKLVSPAVDGKTGFLKDLIKKHDLSLSESYAVGDTASDIAMLEMVANPIAFNPNSDLFNHAKDNNWKIVVERKNVIYELEAEDGKYVLA